MEGECIKKTTSWIVTPRWPDYDSVTSNVSPAHALSEAAKFFRPHPGNPEYLLVERVVTETILWSFTKKELKERA